MKKRPLNFDPEVGYAYRHSAGHLLPTSFAYDKKECYENFIARCMTRDFQESITNSSRAAVQRKLTNAGFVMLKVRIIEVKPRIVEIKS